MRDQATTEKMDAIVEECNAMKADIAALRKELATLKEAATDCGKKSLSPGPIRIGYAVYPDLASLDAASLERLDSELVEYREWVLKEDLLKLHALAGPRMQRMLARYSVRYLDHEAEVRWDDGWKIFTDSSRSDNERVYGLLGNRLYWTNSAMHEGDGALLTEALVTLTGLLEWRKIL
jgi:hypothetical protein